MYISRQWAEIVDENLSIVECIGLFDSGYERIFIVDGRRRFHGLVLERQNFHFVFENKEEWITRIRDDQILNIGEDTTNIKSGLGKQEKNKELVIVHDGIIQGLTIEGGSIKNKSMLDWSLFRITKALEVLIQFDNIYLSSLCSEELRFFYKNVISFIPVHIISEDNVGIIPKSDKNLLIFSVDIYPDKFGNKRSISDMNYIISKKYRDEFISKIQIHDKWAQLKSGNCNVVSCVSLFDEGYDSIYIVNGDNSVLESTIVRQMFKEDLLQKNFRKCTELYVKSIDNIETVFLQGTIKEIAVVNSQKSIVGSCCKRDSFIDIEIDWKYIDLETIEKLFCGRKVLLSSLSGELGNFFQKYAEVLNLDVLDERNIEKYFSDYYDIVICFSDIWEEHRCKIVNIVQLYLDCLAEYVRNYLEGIGVAYYYFNCSASETEILDYGRRHKKYQDAFWNAYDGESKYKMKRNYYILPDLVKDGITIVGGKRKTAYVEEKTYKNRICCFGPCTAIGSHVVDSETWESYIQLKLNELECLYKIQFEGGIGGATVESDINSLYTILDGEYEKGDIVIQLGFKQYNSLLFERKNYYKLVDAYNGSMDVKCFMDWTGHLSDEGNKVVGDYIFNVIKQNIIIGE